ncbi:MAG: RnfH family protein [Porticoccaceae bacterium]
MDDTLITVEVVCATPDQQVVVALLVPTGTVASEAVRRSAIQATFPGLDIAGSALGIFGRQLGSGGLPAADEYILQPQDRVEIYRPLLADPKEVRRQRAARAKQRRG